MHQVKIEIINTADGELAFKERADISFCFEKEVCQLVGQNIFVAGIAACQAFLECRFALSVEITVRRVKIVKACI